MLRLRDVLHSSCWLSRTRLSLPCPVLHMVTINRACSQRCHDQSPTRAQEQMAGHIRRDEGFHINLTTFYGLAFGLGGNDFTGKPIYPAWLFRITSATTTTHDTSCIANGVHDLLLTTCGRAVIYVELGNLRFNKKGTGCICRVAL